MVGMQAVGTVTTSGGLLVRLGDIGPGRDLRRPTAPDVLQRHPAGRRVRRLDHIGIAIVLDVGRRLGRLSPQLSWPPSARTHHHPWSSASIHDRRGHPAGEPS